MKQKSGPDRAPAEQVVKDIRRQTRRQYSAEEKIRIVVEGLRVEENISELCRREASPPRCITAGRSRRKRGLGGCGLFPCLCGDLLVHVAPAGVAADDRAAGFP
jgi:hypothetical protein